MVRVQHKFTFYVLTLLAAAALVWIFAQGCLQSEGDGQICVSLFDPLVQKFRYVVMNLGEVPRWWYNKQFPWYLGFVGMIGLLSFVRGKVRPAIFWALAALPVLGEWYSLNGEKNYALILHLSGLALIAFFWFFSRKNDEYEDSVQPIRYFDILLFLGLILVLLCFRFYALNRIPAAWDTEVCIYRLYASSFNRWWQHESGFAPQASTGISWFMINRLLGNFDEPDLYYLYHRMVGCFLSALKVAVLFLFLRTYFGRFAAFFGASILAFGPAEDWWARVPNFHHWPGLITVLVIWATINAMEKKTWKSFIFLSLLSVTTRWVYPSGMFMVGVPITFFGSLLIFQWSQWKQHFWKISVLLVGVAIWAEWLSVCRALYLGRWEALPPILIPSHSAMPGGLLSKLHQIFILNGAELFSNLFYKQVVSTHWTVLLTPQPWRAMPSVVGILVILAVARMIGQRRDKIMWIMVIALSLGALPGITSSVADRRIGAMFVVLIIIAAREAAWLASYMQRVTGAHFVRFLKVCVPLVLGGYLATLGGAFFFFTTRGVPRQVAIGKVFQQNIKDNYLLIDLTGQLRCDLFHAVYREIRARDCKAGFVGSKYDGEFTPLKLIENPRFDKTEWWYAEKDVTEMHQCADWPTRSWQGATFIITEAHEASQWIEKLQQRFPNGQLERIKVSYLPYEEEEVVVFTTALR